MRRKLTIICISEILEGLAGDVASYRYYSVPDCVVYQRVFLLIGCKYSEGSFEFVQSLSGEVGFVQQVVSRVDDHCELG